MQGSSRSLGLRLRVATAFGASFLAGATAMFAAVFLLGAALPVSDVPVAWRRGLAAAVLAALAAVDLLAIRRATYCPLGWRRQTPRSLMRDHSAVHVAAAWGFDAGLAVTTFRVAALTWGALVLAVLGLAGWWTGIGYGLGFVLPLMVLLWTHRVGRESTAQTPGDPGLEALLSKRATVQLASVGLLTLGGLVVLLQLLA